MPDRIVSVGGIVHKFPADATDAEISAALNAEQAPQKTWMDTALNALPAVGAATGGIVGGLGGTAFGLGVGGVPGAVGGAALGGAAGEAAKQLANELVRGKPVPTTGQAVHDLAQAGVTNAALEAGGAGLAIPLEKGAVALTQSALKPGIRSTLAAFKAGSVPPVIQTLLNEKVAVTPGGIAKLSGIIDASNDAIKVALDAVPAGTTINPYKVTSTLADTAKTFANQVNPTSDLEAVSRVGQEFLDQHPSLSVQAAQDLKTGTYAQLKNKAYGELKGADIEAQKALARGLKQEVASEAAKAGTDISAVNAREGAAITAREAVAKRVAMAGNRDPSGLAWLAANPVSFLMFMAERSPLVKSYLARGMYAAAGAPFNLPANVVRAAVTAVASASDESQP